MNSVRVDDWTVELAIIASNAIDSDFFFFETRLEHLRLHSSVKKPKQFSLYSLQKTDKDST